MVDVVNKICNHESCDKHPTFGLKGSKKGLFCSDHKGPEMIDVVNRRCNH
jgi:hypothetical protein